MCCIIYMTVALTLQRYNAINNPLNNEISNPHLENVSWFRVFKFIGPVILFSVLFKLLEFFEFTTENVKMEDSYKSQSIILAEKIDKIYNTSIRIIVSDMRMDPLYVLLYINIANIIVTGLIPFFLMIYFNFYIYKGMYVSVQWRLIRSRGRRRDIIRNNEIIKQRNQTTVTLFVIVIVFVVCHILRIILNIEDMIIHNITVSDLSNKCEYGHPYWVLITTLVSETLLKLNSSINFFIYCAFYKSFRKIIYKHCSEPFGVSEFQRDMKYATSRVRTPGPRRCDIELSRLTKRSNTL